jgi:hypothetical protein
VLVDESAECKAVPDAGFRSARGRYDAGIPVKAVTAGRSDFPLLLRGTAKHG